MKVATHKIHWPKEWNNRGEDIDFEIVVHDSLVAKVTHPCAKWAIGEWWHLVSSWFEKKYATVTLGEEKEVDESKA